jgi:hypothetical protein
MDWSVCVQILSVCVHSVQWVCEVEQELIFPQLSGLQVLGIVPKQLQVPTPAVKNILFYFFVARCAKSFMLNYLTTANAMS